MHAPRKGGNIIAVDMGTSGCRALLFDRELRVKGIGKVNVPLVRSNAGHVEVDPKVLMEAVTGSVAQTMAFCPAKATEVEGISLSTPVSSLLALDSIAEPIGGIWMWSDNRASHEAAVLRHDYGRELYWRTICPIHASYWPARLRWIASHEPQVWKKAAKLVTAKSWVLHNLTGQWVDDISMASSTGLVNPEVCDWDDVAIRIAGAKRERLVDLVDTRQVVGGLGQQVAAKMGLLAGTPVVAGASDGVLSNLGAGAVFPGQVATMIGTSAAVRAAFSEPKRDAEGRLWCYPLTRERWVLGGASNSGGGVALWVTEMLRGDRNALAPPSAETNLQAGGNADEPLLTLITEASKVSAGADGLIFLPYVFGERCPLWDEGARGAFVGLSGSHERRHVIRAVLEGLTFGLYTIYLLITSHLEQVAEVRATGGFTKSLPWLEIEAAVFDQEIAVPAESEGSALGAAILGLEAVGATTIEEQARRLPVAQRVKPSPEAARIYRNYYPHFKAAYHALQPTFHELIKLGVAYESISDG